LRTSKKIIFLLFKGDFNLDCGYVSKSNRELIRTKLFDFKWLINDGTPTTVSSKSCAYDRIMVSDTNFFNFIVPNSNLTFYYQNEFGLDIEEV
jgi:hypothetical protein